MRQGGSLGWNHIYINHTIRAKTSRSFSFTYPKTRKRAVCKCLHLIKPSSKHDEMKTPKAALYQYAIVISSAQSCSRLETFILIRSIFNTLSRRAKIKNVLDWYLLYSLKHSGTACTYKKMSLTVLLLYIVVGRNKLYSMVANSVVTIHCCRT